MPLFDCKCSECLSDNINTHSTYRVHEENRRIYKCNDCGAYFSETKNTPLAGLRTPLSRIITILDALNEGLGVNAATRVFKVSKNSIYRWIDRLIELKQVLLVYALCHQFLVQLIEGDELYTKVNQNKPPSESEGWTIVLMDRATRFIWELECGQKDRSLFESAINTLVEVISKTDDLSPSFRRASLWEYSI